MGVIWDIIKEIPTAAVLKEKILDLDAKLAALETENSILKGDLRKATEKIEKLQNENKRLTETKQLTPVTNTEKFEPDTVDRRILAYMFVADREVNKSEIATVVNLPFSAEAEFHLERLKHEGYLYSPSRRALRAGFEVGYLIKQYGREYVLQNDLISAAGMFVKSDPNGA